METNTSQAFEINHIKLVHSHFSSGCVEVGIPIETSIELNCHNSLESEKLEWNKVISHTYYNLTGGHEKTTDSFTTELIDCEKLITEINKIDLRKLRNNYYTDRNPERFSHWEINYNYYFKIVGTYDQEIDEIKRLSELLDFKKIVKIECDKIDNKIVGIG